MTEWKPWKPIVSLDKCTQLPVRSISPPATDAKKQDSQLGIIICWWLYVFNYIQYTVVIQHMVIPKKSHQPIINRCFSTRFLSELPGRFPSVGHQKGGDSLRLPGRLLAGGRPVFRQLGEALADMTRDRWLRDLGGSWILVISYRKSLNMDLIITVVSGVGTINFLTTQNPLATTYPTDTY